jgi:hypothetical protein
LFHTVEDHEQRSEMARDDRHVFICTFVFRPPQVEHPIALAKQALWDDEM